MKKQFITDEEAIEAFGLSQEILDIMKKGRHVGHYQIGSLTLFKEKEIVDFLQSSYVEPTKKNETIETKQEENEEPEAEPEKFISEIENTPMKCEDLFRILEGTYRPPRSLSAPFLEPGIEEIYWTFWELLDPIDKEYTSGDCPFYFTETMIRSVNARVIKNFAKANRIKEQLLGKYSRKQLFSSGIFRTAQFSNFFFSEPCIVFPLAPPDNFKPFFLARKKFDYNQWRGVQCTKVLLNERFYYGNSVYSDDTICVFTDILDALSYQELTGKSNFVAITGIVTCAKIEKIKSVFPGKNIEIEINSRNKDIKNSSVSFFNWWEKFIDNKTSKYPLPDKMSLNRLHRLIDSGTIEVNKEAVKKYPEKPEKEVEQEEETDFISTSQAAQMAGVTQPTIGNWIASGNIKGYKGKNSNRQTVWFIDKKSLEEFIDM